MSGLLTTISEAEHHTAIHEAGHAVIGRVLGLICGPATIVPDYSDMSAGHAITKNPYVTWDAWEARRKSRRFRSVVRGWIMMQMAGREAEIAILGCGGVGDSEDRWNIDDHIGDAELDFDDLARWRDKTRGLVIRHREKIARVALVLLDRRTLTAEAIDALVFPKKLDR